VITVERLSKADSSNDRFWPIAMEIRVPWHVGDQGKNGRVLLNVSFVARDRCCRKSRKLSSSQNLTKIGF
jgi:hypothetical protein